MIRDYKYLIQIIGLVIASVLYFGLRALPQSKASSSKDAFLYVARVVDGDTLKLSNGQKIRLIGVDTPEVHYSDKLLRDAKSSHRDIHAIQGLGRRAAYFTKGLCLGKRVRLEYDVDAIDKYGRVLAYVYLSDGTFINAKILEEGYGKVMTIPPNVKYADYFLRLQKSARSNNKGLWKDENAVALDK